MYQPLAHIKSTCDIVRSILKSLKPGFHSNAIACVGKHFHATNASASPIGMLGRCSGNHDWLLANALAVFVYATQAIVFEWKPGFTLLSDHGK